MRWNWILGDDGGIWFLSLWRPREVLTIYLTSVEIINFSTKSRSISSYLHRNLSSRLWTRLSPVIWGATVVAGVRSGLCFMFHSRRLRVWRIGRRISSINFGGESVMLRVLLRVLLLISDEALALSRLKLLRPLGGHRELLGFVWSSTRSRLQSCFPSCLWTSLSETRSRINNDPSPVNDKLLRKKSQNVFPGLPHHIADSSKLLRETLGSGLPLIWRRCGTMIAALHEKIFLSWKS